MTGYLPAKDLFFWITVWSSRLVFVSKRWTTSMLPIRDTIACPLGPIKLFIGLAWIQQYVIIVHTASHLTKLCQPNLLNHSIGPVIHTGMAVSTNMHRLLREWRTILPCSSRPLQLLANHVPLSDQHKSCSLIFHLQRLFMSYGVPEETSSDGGPQFSSSSFNIFLEDWLTDS